MSKILSQEEIDALLAAAVKPGLEAGPFMPGSTAGAVRAMPYDFKHPNRVSKDQLRKFENIHDTFAGKLSSALSHIQRAMVDADLVSVGQVTYTEFINSLKAPSCTYTFKLAPLKGLCILNIKSSLAFAIVDRLFGGRGAALDNERELTGIERNVMRTIMGRVFEELENGWERVLEVRAEPVGFETNPHFVQIVPPGETVIVVSLQLNMPEARGIISIGYPYVTLEGILDKLATQNWHQSSRVSDQPRDAGTIEALLHALNVTVDAQLTTTQMTLSEVLSLRPGVVLPLDMRVGDPVTLNVEGRPKYSAVMGNTGRKRAIRIDGPLDAKGD